jgi:DNA-binding transcriptional MerR regulator
VKKLFTPGDVTRLLPKITYRRLQYWDKTGLIQPTMKRRDKYRLYTSYDLFLFYVVDQLRPHYSIQRLPQILKQIRKVLNEAKAQILTLTLMIENGAVVLFEGRVWFDEKQEAKKREWIFAPNFVKLLLSTFPPERVEPKEERRDEGTAVRPEA